MIPYGRQSISDEDIEAVVKVLRADFLTQGPVVPAFEDAISAYCDSRHAVAVNSGTSALHLACLSLDLGPGDWLWTSPITYVATANSARYCGANVDFVDVEAGTHNMSVSALQDKLEKAEAKGVLPKVLIAVHFAGAPCDMEAIAELAGRYQFRIIEDAAHALGATYQNAKTGAGLYADITTFSFHPVKVITSAEGGMAMTNDQALAMRMRRLRSHGIDNNRDSKGSWTYRLIDLGFNYRLNDMQAALGLSQLQGLDEFIARRTELARRYDDKLAGLPLHLPLLKPQRSSAWHLYVINFELDKCRLSRAEVFSAMRAAGIGVNVHYMPVYEHPYYLDLYGENVTCPQAQAYYASTLTLPLHPALTDAEQDKVVEVLQGLLR